MKARHAPTLTQFVLPASFKIPKSRDFLEEIDHLRILRLVVGSVYLGCRRVLICSARAVIRIPTKWRFARITPATIRQDCMHGFDKLRATLHREQRIITTFSKELEAQF